MNLTEYQKNQIRNWLHAPKSYSDPYHPNSIMDYKTVCSHDSSFMCKCRVEKLIELLEEYCLYESKSSPFGK
jgi:hypothetical protein